MGSWQANTANPRSSIHVIGCSTSLCPSLVCGLSLPKPAPNPNSMLLLLLPPTASLPRPRHADLVPSSSLSSLGSAPRKTAGQRPASPEPQPPFTPAHLASVRAGSRHRGGTRHTVASTTPPSQRKRKAAALVRDAEPVPPPPKRAAQGATADGAAVGGNEPATPVTLAATPSMMDSDDDFNSAMSSADFGDDMESDASFGEGKTPPGFGLEYNHPSPLLPPHSKLTRPLQSSPTWT